jgi:hypothetical protein
MIAATAQVPAIHFHFWRSMAISVPELPGKLWHTGKIEPIMIKPRFC